MHGSVTQIAVFWNSRNALKCTFLPVVMPKAFFNTKVQLQKYDSIMGFKRLNYVVRQIFVHYYCYAAAAVQVIKAKLVDPPRPRK